MKKSKSIVLYRNILLTTYFPPTQNAHNDKWEGGGISKLIQALLVKLDHVDLTDRNKVSVSVINSF